MSIEIISFTADQRTKKLISPTFKVWLSQ